MAGEHRVVVKIEPRPDTPLGWLLKAKVVCSEAGGNPETFSSIAALLTKLAGDTQALDGLQAKTPKGAPSDTAARNVAWGVLKKSLRAFARGVQGLCDAAPDADQARATAVQAGLDCKVVPARDFPPLRGKALGNGVVRLYGRLPARGRTDAFFEWQMCTDGRSYATFATTNNATTTVHGLTPGTIVYFRCRSTFKNVTSSWSETSVIVH
jgi:hypothetical protein